MPMIISGNTSIPAMMIGERCADMVLSDATPG
jgi:choline dehydrogenase